MCVDIIVIMCRTYWQFLSRVAVGRDMSMQEARKVAKGRIWTGQDALQHGLVDKLGGLQDAVHIAKQEADLSLVSSIKSCNQCCRLVAHKSCTHSQAALNAMLLPSTLVLSCQARLQRVLLHMLFQHVGSCISQSAVTVDMKHKKPMPQPAAG